jgi:acyl carrier protein phosphodiesterase
LFSTERRRFAGVVIDVSFDYFLIKHWQTLSDIDLASFINSSYVGLEACTKWMPLRMQMVCRKMHEYDWLSQYGQLTGIATSIDMISNRIRFKNNMAGSIVEVERNYDAIEVVFLDLIVYLQEEVKRAAFEKG